VLDELSSDPLAPYVWLDKKRIELSVSVSPRQNRRETDNCTAPLRDKHLPGRYLLGREIDRIRIREYRFAIPRIGEGGTSLQ